MSNIYWLDRDKQIVYWNTFREGDIADVFQDFDHYISMVQSVEGPVFLILDFTANDTPRTDIVPHFPALGRRLSAVKDRVPFVSVVSEKLFAKSLMKIFGSVTEDEIHYFSTVEDAIAFINEYQESHLPEI